MVEMRKNGRCGVLKGPRATPRNAEAVVVYKKLFVLRPSREMLCKVIT